jgi:hypothetical protein
MERRRSFLSFSLSVVGVNEQNVGYFVMYLVESRSCSHGHSRRMIEWLGEARLCRLGLVLLAAGLMLVCGDSFLSDDVLFHSRSCRSARRSFFPAVTAMLSRVVAQTERGLYMGVQHTVGGISRVSFPLATATRWIE